MSNPAFDAADALPTMDAPVPFSGAELFLRAGRNPPRSCALKLSARSRQMLDRICGGDPLTEIVALQGALALLLHRYGATAIELLTPSLLLQPDSRIGSEVIAFRYRVDETLSGREWLLQSQQIAATTYDRPAVASGEAVAQIRDARVHAPFPAETGGRLCLTFGENEGDRYRLDDPGGMLPPGFAARFAGHLDAVLEGLAELDAPISAIVLLDADECERLNELEDGGPPRAVSETLTSLVQRWCQATPDAVALVGPKDALRGPTPAAGRLVRYDELEREAARIAYHLVDRCGVRPGVRVAVAATRSVETVLAYTGVLASGAAIVPFDPTAPLSLIAEMLEQAEATVLLVPPESMELALASPGLLTMCPALEAETWPDAPTSFAPVSEPGDIAALVFTSGSEGKPKAVLLPHAGLANTVADHVARLKVETGDRCLQFMAPFFDGGLLDIFTPLAGGAALVCPPATALADPQAFQVFLAEAGVTLLTVTPAYLSVLDVERLPRLRVAISAAERARAADFRRLAPKLSLFNGYGPTEASINTTLYAAPPRFDGESVPIGRPSAGKRVMLVDAQGRRLPQGVIGEIVISGTGLAEGYLNDADSTAQRFPVREDGERSYRSGDLAAWDEDGQLNFIGRRDQQVKIGGRRVELGQIEWALFESAGVRDAAVLFDDGRLRAFFAPDHAIGPNAEAAMLVHLKTLLPTHMIPAALHAVDALPRKPNGKVNGVALAQLARERRARLAAFRVRTSTEAALLEIWREALQIEEIDEEADFFRLGGDSIRMIDAVHAARERGLDIEVADLIDHRTLRALAQAVDGRASGGDMASDPVDLSLTEEERASLPPGFERAFPVSGMQALMLRWYDDPLCAANDVYHCVARWQVRDPGVREERLIAAARALVRRHPILRTGVAMAAPSGRPVQAELPEREFPLRVTDLTDLAGEAQEAAAARIFANERRERFRIEATPSPFARLHLIVRSAERFDVILAAHHAVMDGWSSVLLENDFALFYRQAGDGELDIDAMAVCGTYAEFVAADLRARQSSSAAAFWRERWRSAPNQTVAAHAPTAELPLFRNLETQLDPELVTAVSDYGARQGRTPKAICLAALLSALSRTLGATPPIGVVANGRSARLRDPLGSTGLFWNVVPFMLTRGAADPAPDPDAVQAELEAMVPFEGHPLAEILSAARREQLFDICFNFIQMHHARTGFGGLEEIGFEAVDRFHYGLTLFVDYTPAVALPRCSLRFEYRSDRWSDDAVVQLSTGFTDALASIVQPMAAL